MSDQQPQADVTVEVAFEDLIHLARLCGLTETVIARCSVLFLLELYAFEAACGINPSAIADEVRALEDQTQRSRGTKPADRFRHPPLRGLWKKHFFCTSFMMKNLDDAWKQGGHLDRLILAALDPTRACLEETHHEYAVRLSREIAEQAVAATYRQRRADSRLAGEWIVFAKHRGENHYLSVSRHTEGDHVIHAKIIRYCVPQFSFLKDILPPLSAGE